MNALTRWRPLSEMSTLQNEMNQLFGRFFGAPAAPDDDWPAASGYFPVTNVTETADNLILTCEVPGVDPKDIDISLAGDVLTIKGEKRQDKDEKTESYHRVERSYGSFTRAFRLPAPVVVDKVAPDYRNGVLRVTLPKTDESRRREVKVKVG